MGSKRKYVPSRGGTWFTTKRRRVSTGFATTKRRTTGRWRRKRSQWSRMLNLIKPERKYVYTTANAAGLDAINATGGRIELVHNIAVGTGVGDRDGNKIMLKSISIWGQLKNKDGPYSTQYPYSKVRFVLCQCAAHVSDGSLTEAAAAVHYNSKLWTFPTDDMYNKRQDKKATYIKKIIWDKTYILGQKNMVANFGGAAADIHHYDKGFPLRKKFKINQVVTYTSNAVDTQECDFILYWQANQDIAAAVAAELANGFIKISFVDL